MRPALTTPRSFRDVDELRRTYTVDELGLVDGDGIPEIDNLTLLAASIFSAPVSLLSIVQPELDRQFFTSSNGLAEPVQGERQTPLSHSFCQHVVARNDTLMIGNSRRDSLVADNPSVDELGVIAYLGTPVYVDGQPVGALCVIDDKPRLWRGEDAQNLERLGACVSEAIQARARLLDQERLHGELNALTERLSNAVNAGAVGLWERDPDSGEFWLSETFDKMLGGGTSRWTGLEDLIARVHPEDRGLFADSALTGHESGRSYERVYRLLADDGSCRWMRSLSALTQYPNGARMVAGATIDISIEREREQQVTLLNSDLERSNGDLAEFARIASHDLRSPLRAIRGLVQMAREDYRNIPNGLQRRLDQIDTRASRMSSLLEGLTDYLGGGSFEAAPQELALLPLVEEIFELLDCPDGISLTVDAQVARATVDRTVLSTAIRNLVDNAIKHRSAAPGDVSVILQRVGSDLVVEVTDNGPGIAAEHQERIFQPFQTLQPRDVVEGSGLGLSLVERLMQRAGGTIEVESTPGQGSTFRLRLLDETPSAPMLQ